MKSTPHFLAEQLDAVFTDITPDAVKIGMVSSAELIETIAAKLKQYGAKHIVVDPVMVATSGSKLLRDDAVSALCANLLPMAEVLTPNIPEAEILADMPIKNAADMEKAAQTISEKYGCAVLCKGGHQINDADDLLWRGGAGKWFRGKRIDNPNTHGTGCTLSSAIASNLAKGYDLDDFGRARKGLHLRRTGRHAGPGPRLRPDGPYVCKAETGRFDRMKKTSTFQNGLIWFGAGVSLAEILTGTSFAPLGMAKGFAAILIGHIIGCAMMLLAGLIGGRTGRSAMETVKMSFGQKGGLLFAFLNVLQLVGWTAIMIYDGALAVGGIFAIGRWVWCLVIGALIVRVDRRRHH